MWAFFGTQCNFFVYWYAIGSLLSLLLLAYPSLDELGDSVAWLSPWYCIKLTQYTTRGNAHLIFVSSLCIGYVDYVRTISKIVYEVHNYTIMMHASPLVTIGLICSRVGTENAGPENDGPNRTGIWRTWNLGLKIDTPNGDFSRHLLCPSWSPSSRV